VSHRVWATRAANYTIGEEAVHYYQDGAGPCAGMAPAAVVEVVIPHDASFLSLCLSSSSTWHHVQRRLLMAELLDGDVAHCMACDDSAFSRAQAAVGA
jgi:hypothetical protein